MTPCKVCRQRNFYLDSLLVWTVLKNFLFCVWIFKYNWKRCTLSTLSFSSFNWAKYVHASKDVDWYLSLNDVISWFFNNTIARVSTCRERNRKKRKKMQLECFTLLWYDIAREMVSFEHRLVKVNRGKLLINTKGGCILTCLT